MYFFVEKTNSPVLIEMTDTLPEKDPKQLAVKNKKDAKASQALLNEQSGVKKRYAISEIAQMWIVLKRALLFSRRDWVIKI